MPSGPGVQPAWASSALALARSNGIELVELHVLVAEHAGRQHAERRAGRALHDVVEDRLAIDRVQQRLPHAHVVERRQPGVQPGEDDADAGRLVDGVLRVLAQRRELGRRGEQHHVGVAGLERDHPRAFLGHDLEDHAVEQRLVAPVVVVPLDDHVGVGLPLHELERSGADRRPAEVLRPSSGRPSATRSPMQYMASVRRIGPYGSLVTMSTVRSSTTSALVERAGEAGPPRRRGALERAVERELDRLGVEGRAVVELHVRAQLEAHLGGRHHLVATSPARA